VSFGLPLGVEVETVPSLAGMGESVVVGIGTTPIGCLQLKPGAVTFVTSARIAPAKAAHKAPGAWQNGGNHPRPFRPVIEIGLITCPNRMES